MGHQLSDWLFTTMLQELDCCRALCEPLARSRESLIAAVCPALCRLEERMQEEAVAAGSCLSPHYQLLLLRIARLMSIWQVIWPMSKMAPNCRWQMVDDRHHEHKASLNTFRTLHPVGLIRLFLWPLHHCPLLMFKGTHFYFALEKPWKRHHVTPTAWCTRAVSRQICIF